MYISQPRKPWLLKVVPKNQKSLKKRIEIQMGGQGLCSVTADGTKILTITIQASKC